MKNLKRRLPGMEAILPVFAVTAFMVYAWTIVIFLWKVPSWLMFRSLTEILGTFAYAMVAAMLESLGILGILLLASLVLPRRWMRDMFVTRGTVAAAFMLGTIMSYMYRLSLVGYSYIVYLVQWSLAGLAITLLAVFFSSRVRMVVRAVAWISDRLIVLLFLLVPVTLISLLIVLYRNMF